MSFGGLSAIGRSNLSQRSRRTARCTLGLRHHYPGVADAARRPRTRAKTRTKPGRPKAGRAASDARQGDGARPGRAGQGGAGQGGFWSCRAVT